jgi:hypothetical protein
MSERILHDESPSQKTATETRAKGPSWREYSQEVRNAKFFLEKSARKVRERDFQTAVDDLEWTRCMIEDLVKMAKSLEASAA